MVLFSKMILLLLLLLTWTGRERVEDEDEEEVEEVEDEEVEDEEVEEEEVCMDVHLLKGAEERANDVATLSLSNTLSLLHLFDRLKEE